MTNNYNYGNLTTLVEDFCFLFLHTHISFLKVQARNKYLLLTHSVFLLFLLSI